MPDSLPPPPEQLDAVLRSRSGTLEETPYPILLVALATREATAVLELHRNQLQKTIFFDAGAPVECRSNIATEMLGRYLVAGGKVSEQDCHAAFAVAASRGVPLGEVLTERKLLAPSELYRALQQNLGRKLLEPFSWKSGTWSISTDAPPMRSVLRVKVPQLLVTGIVKVETQESADEAAAAVIGKYVATGKDPLFAPGSVRLNAGQQKIVEAARRGAGYEELLSSGGIDTDDLNRVLYALLLLGMIRVTEQPVREAPQFELETPFVVEPELETPIVVPVEVFAGGAPAHPVTVPAPPARPTATDEEVMAAYLSCRRKDPLELLDLDDDAGAVQIRRAYLAMAEKFLPSNYEDGGDGLQEKAQEVFLAAARAYAELADPERREALVKTREKLREQAAAAAQAGAAALIDPEALCRSGRTLAGAGKLREALSSFEMAAECDAQNGTYAAEAAWCRYQLRHTPPATALKLLKNAIRIDPSSGVAHLYAGQVQAMLGHRLEAQAYIGKAATLLPGDPRPIEALKALQR